jgi:hypothetical protein
MDEITRRQFIQSSVLAGIGLSIFGKLTNLTDKVNDDLIDKVNSENNQTIKSNCLIQGDASRYYNKHIAMISFSDRRVVAFGDNLGKVMQEARQLGYEHPVGFYVLHPNVSFP